MSTRSTPRPGRIHVAALAASALVGAAGAATAASGDTRAHDDTVTATGHATQTGPDHSAPGEESTHADVVLDERPQPVTVDAQLIESVARQVLLEQSQPENLTNTDLIARDVLSQAPATPADAERLTREAMSGFGPGAPVDLGPEAAPVLAPPQCPPTARACIDVDGKVAWMLDNGRVTYGPVPTTTGRPGHETERGTHHVIRHVRHDHSIPFDSPMPYSTYFTIGGIAFHEGRLDEPSHGCIHLGQQAAAHFFHNLKVGDEVVAY